MGGSSSREPRAPRAPRATNVKAKVGAKDALVGSAVTHATANIIKHVVPAALLPPQAGPAGQAEADANDSGASKLAKRAGRAVGEGVARMAVQAMQGAEASAIQAIERALPVSGVAAYVPPVELYTEVYECDDKVRPKYEAFKSTLEDAVSLGEWDTVLKLYAQVFDRGAFEETLCGVDREDAKKRQLLLDTIAEVVKGSTQTAVEIAEMLGGERENGGPKKGGPEKGEREPKANASLRAAICAAAIRASEPESGILWGWYTKSATDLRNLEVFVRAIRPDPNAEPDEDERALVARVRAATWSAVLSIFSSYGAEPIDMTRFGSRYGVVPLPVLRDYTVQMLPDVVEHASEAVNFGLGEWGLLDSLGRVMRFAVERFKLSDPEKAARVEAYAQRGKTLGDELLGLYVVRQHVGFERRGVGYALAVATGTLRTLPRTTEYAHAIRCLLAYIRDLLGQQIGPATDEAIACVALASPSSAETNITPKAPKPGPEYTLPSVPLACRGAPAAHDARTRRLVREVCARNAELVEKGRAVEWLNATFAKATVTAGAAVTVDAMFEMHDALGAVVSRKLASDVARNVANALETMSAATDLTVTQRRRLEVLQTRFAEALGGGKAPSRGGGARGGEAPSPHPHRSYYEHVVRRAKDGKPHGLHAHEFGVAHTAFYVGPTVVYRWPLVEARAQPSSWMGALLARLVPDPVQSVVDAAWDAASGRAVQYRGGERPGVGYALYALLPVLDHASAMGYKIVQHHTLVAIGRLWEVGGVATHAPLERR